MTSSAGKILVVDDDSAIRRALRASLTGLGFETAEASSGEDAVELVRSEELNAVLLDINMPGVGGMEACSQIRRLQPLLPILILTVRDSQDDIVRAFELGADDYITKPFSVRELTARLRAAVRRSRAVSQTPKLLVVGDVELDPERRIVKKKGQPVHLTPKEFDLLAYLMANTGKPIRHAKLLQAVWGPEYGNELEYLRTFIRQLRTKIEDEPARPAYLLTDPYVGYRFCEPSSEETSPL